MKQNHQPRTMSQEFYVVEFLRYYRDPHHSAAHRRETLDLWRVLSQASGEYCGAYKEAVKRIDAEGVK